jgi:cell cycle arrest protein BUB2
MNVLLAPFLMIMPELDAFFCFCTFIRTCCPRYVYKNLDGVHHGCKLVEQLLSIFDPDLSNHLNGKVTAEIYAFQSVLTFLASMKPITEVLKVWDVLISIGFYFNVVFFTSHLVVLRDALLRENSSYR